METYYRKDLPPRNFQLLFRRHRGSFEDSMKTVCEVKDFEHLLTILRDDGIDDANEKSVEIVPYGYDPRNEWGTWLVKVNGCAIGYTNDIVYPPFFGPTITYRHPKSKDNSMRFRQLAKDPVPSWAVDIQPGE